MKERGSLKDFWENFGKYLCSAVPLIMTLVMFTNIFSRKIPRFNVSFTRELTATMPVWVCCLAAASVFKTDSHMGFNYLTDKFQDVARRTCRACQLLLCTANCEIRIIWGIQVAYRQYRYNLLTGILKIPQWTTGIATPLLAVCSITRMVQYETRLAKERE